ncbi:beta-ketoacyl-ACP synthase III [Desulfofustis glycolicus]|uniref:3-oxoacyl-[acyl-carrier-protein] synthase-3 n=1 Tax=Desulfofustis glycolicus DSM 9705 TaxID=1121409 RepID=A0A1M5UMF7_9BACT|nr:beta-ketoacyl-ACP synthase III [Desulfofustis glycolicus]MCB2217413.1 beta-ketoacyl-ACP synthase III [Desulfobulbaceae bacterium]SHH64110.1 3-oxoacyl-[acyl-carrier-protein] synthase-3 [Desulfofustis glycolicus DSM 9705]
MNAYITAVSAFLPGAPVSNEDLDRFLGSVEKLSSRTRRLILAGNGIKTRYYAIDPDSGRSTHSNAALTAEAVRLLQSTIGGEPIACLCCGTSSPDQLMPGHASMVHGELGIEPCEVVSTAGVCLTGITALKYGAMAVALGASPNAVATGSESASSYLGNDFFMAMNGGARDEVGEGHPAFCFEADFLRWMLSDGAGAVWIDNRPAGDDRLSLRIDWIEIISHAQRLESCMYAGAIKHQDGSLTGWRELLRQGQPAGQGIFTIKQDARLLNRQVIATLVGDSLPPLVAKYRLAPDDIDWFLPHYSSDYFRVPLAQQLHDIGFAIPEDRWYTNLADKGNTGSASFFIMLEELFRSGKLRKGDRLLGMIPESGRFSVGYLQLTVL